MAMTLDAVKLDIEAASAEFHRDVCASTKQLLARLSDREAGATSESTMQARLAIALDLDGACAAIQNLEKGHSVLEVIVVPDEENANSDEIADKNHEETDA